MRQNALAQQTDLPRGIFCGYNMNDAKAKYYKSIGLLPLKVPGTYGSGAVDSKLTLHAVLDAFEKVVYGERPYRPDFERWKPVDVLCIGLASKNITISMREKPKEEHSYGFFADSFKGPENKDYIEIADEIGGQMLVPAVTIARQGMTVAFAGRIGTDKTGEEVAFAARKLAGERERKTKKQKPREENLPAV